MRAIKPLFFICLLLVIATNAQGGEMLKVGEMAPDFAGDSFDGQHVDSAAMRQNNPLLLVFLRGFG